MKKINYRSISDTDYLNSEQLDSIEMGKGDKCEPSCKKGCAPSNHSGTTSEPAPIEQSSLQVF